MNWKWWKKVDTSESERALEVARQRRMETVLRWPTVQERAAWAHGRVRENGLTEVFYTLMGEREK